MAVETKASVAARFVAYAFPSAADFGNLIDSYTDYGGPATVLNTALGSHSGGGGRIVSFTTSVAAQVWSAATVGMQFLGAATTGAAVSRLGAGTVGSAVFTATTEALAQLALGGGNTGRQIFGAATTAAVTSILDTPTTASQAEMEAATTGAKFVSPDVLKYHPLSPKAWALISGGTTPEIKASYNVAAATRKAQGQYSVRFSDPMSTANYAIIATGQHDGAARLAHASSAAGNTAAGFFVRIIDTAGADQDPIAFSVTVFGDI